MSPQTTTAPVNLHTSPSRVAAIDVVRGLVMVIMALDHIREFYSPTPFQPEDLTQTTPALFFTRWLTHLCAPTFVFLAGTSIYLYQQRQFGRGPVSRFLLARGLWLLALEVLVISFLLLWSYQVTLLQVIWVFGWGMLGLAGLIWLPRWLTAGLAGAILLSHNAWPAAFPVTGATLGWALLYHQPFLFSLGTHQLLVAYVVLPWLAVMTLGYCLGPWFGRPLAQLRRRLAGAGVGALGLFGVLRALNIYGDPAPWQMQPRGAGYTVLSFLNVTKYPPSLLFLSLMLGVALLLLALAAGRPTRLGNWLQVYGRVPLFYYLLHFVLISGGAWGWTTVAFGRPVNLSFLPPGQPLPAAYHPSLLRAYVVWVLIVGLLYWPCRWYRRYKQDRAHWWLRYL